MYQPIPVNTSHPSTSRARLQEVPFGHPILLSQAYPGFQNGSQMPTLSRVMPVGSQSMVYPAPGQQYSPSFMPPCYLVQPMPIMRRHPQPDLNMNFDYQSANFLCQAKIVQNTIYCVLCKSEYKADEKQEHIKKHIRKSNLSPIKKDVSDKLNAYRKDNRQTKKGYIIKPIVEPEEFNIQYEPTVYNLVKEVHYLDESDVEKCEKGIGNEGNSFSFYDNNVTLNNNAMNYIPNRLIQTEPNPFDTNPSQLPLHPYQGDEMNSPSRKSQKMVNNLMSQIKEEQQPLFQSQMKNSKNSSPEKSKPLIQSQMKNSKSNSPDKSNASSNSKQVRESYAANNRPEQINNQSSISSPERASSAFKKKPERMNNSLAYVENEKINGSVKKDPAEAAINSINQQIPFVQQSRNSSGGQPSSQSKNSSKQPQRQSEVASPPMAPPHDTTFNRESFSNDFTKYVPEQINNRGPVDQLQSFSGPIEIKGPSNEQSKKQSENIAQLLKQFGGDSPSNNVQRKRLPNRVEW